MANSISPEFSTPFAVLGLPVHLASNYGALLADRVARRQGCHVVTLNAEMTMQAENSPALANIIRNAELVIPDGAGIVLYSRLFGRKIDRCPGIELAASLLQSSARSDQPWSIFFFGGAPDVAEQAAASWRAKVPGISIVGVQHGYLKPEDEPEFLDRLKTLQPQVIYVGLGVPRQELWIAQHRHICPNSVWIGIGGSFDIWAGTKTRAPKWLCDHNLEWTYRLYQEPWRWKRMLALPKFAMRSLVYRLTGR